MGNRPCLVLFFFSYAQLSSSGLGFPALEMVFVKSGWCKVQLSEIFTRLWLSAGSEQSQEPSSVLSCLLSGPVLELLLANCAQYSVLNKAGSSAVNGFPAGD